MADHAKTGLVQSFERVTTEDGTELVEVTIDAGGGELLVLEHVAECGEDAPPLAGDYAAIGDSTGQGAVRSAGYTDTKNAGVALGGEKRTYGRAPDGTLAGFIWIHGNGLIELVGLASGQAYKIGKVMIDADGNITTPGEVTAKAGTPASVGLSTHLHDSGTGPTAPPTAGT